MLSLFVIALSMIIANSILMIAIGLIGINKVGSYENIYGKLVFNSPVVLLLLGTIWLASKLVRIKNITF